MPTGPGGEKFLAARDELLASRDRKGKERRVNVVRSEAPDSQAAAFRQTFWEQQIQKNPEIAGKVQILQQLIAKREGVKPQERVKSQHCHVRMVGTAAPGLTTLPLYQHIAPPKYNGKLADWPNFKNRWEGFIVQFLAEAPDRTILECLRNCVDEATVDRLDTAYGQNLTYLEFWEILEK